MLSRVLLVNCRTFSNTPPSLRTPLFNVRLSYPRLQAASQAVRQCSTKSRRSSDLQRLFAYIGPEKRTLFAAIGLLSLSSFATIAFPFLIGRTIDTIYKTDDKQLMKERLNYIVAVVAGLAVIGGAANYGRVYFVHVASQRITNRICKQAHSAIIKQETAFFDRQKTGELLSRLSNDAAQMGNSLTQNVSDGLRSFLSIVGGIGMMIYTSPQLSLVGLSVVPPVAAFAIVYGRRLRTVATNVQSKLAHSNGIAEEQFSNIRTVRMFTKEPLESERYSASLNDVLAARTEEAKKRAIFFGTTGATGNVVIMSVLYYGGSLISEGLISVGSLSSFLIYAAYVGISMAGLSSFMSETMKALGASQKLWSLMDRKPLVPFGQGSPISSDMRGSVHFRDVNFRYSTRDTNILSNLSLDIPAGKVTAIVGPSGSGKSTLGGLILRLYDPDSGQVRIDGQDLSQVNPTSLRDQIGVVAQEPVLFSTTIRQNIEYGSVLEDVSFDDVVEAARHANALDFINAFPEKFETVVGERGVMLSGGQKQRIAIARAILRKPKILILDEATSSLDSISERVIQDVLENFSKGRTVIVIAHRLSTIQSAEKIVVLKEGRIAQQGSFNELVAIEDGVFRQLVLHQMQSLKT